MRWLAKAALQKGLSALPRAEDANYLFQRHLTHSLPAREARLRRQFRRARGHARAYAKHAPGRALGEARLYEFGAGWDLALPLCLWCLGVDRQVLVDVRPNLRPELVSVTLERLHRLRPWLERKADGPLRDAGTAPVSSDGQLEHRFGIVYLAPCDSRATGLAPGSVDFVSSTNTLEHVPAEDVTPILAECQRLLDAEGVISCRIDLRDHYSYFDRSISPYNFLRYSAPAWRLANSSLMHQNRLRYPDYLAAFEEAGFELLNVRVGRPRPRQLECLERLRVAPEFRERYSLEELAAPSLGVVARPAPTRRSPEAPGPPPQTPGGG